MANCEDCRHAEMDYCEYYGCAKEWIVVGCKKEMDANADECEEHLMVVEEMPD